MSKHKVSCAVFDPWPGPCDCSDPSDTDARVRRVMDAADRYASEVADTPHMPTPVERKLAETKIESRRAELERVVRECVR